MGVRGAERRTASRVERALQLRCEKDLASLNYSNHRSRPGASGVRERRRYEQMVIARVMTDLSRVGLQTEVAEQLQPAMMAGRTEDRTLQSRSRSQPRQATQTPPGPRPPPQSQAECCLSRQADGNRPVCTCTYYYQQHNLDTTKDTVTPVRNNSLRKFYLLYRGMQSPFPIQTVESSRKALLQKSSSRRVDSGYRSRLPMQ